MSRESKLDVHDWYDPINDLVECLVCHKYMKMLSTHVKTHSMTSSQYRETFNIFRTTPLSSKSFIKSRKKEMVKLRAEGKVIVSQIGVEPLQLVGKEATNTKENFMKYKEFDSVRESTRSVHKGKKLSIEHRKAISERRKGVATIPKTNPVVRLCERCKGSFSCMRWQPNKYCSKRCAALSNKNWLYRNTTVRVHKESK